jgi:hypothetical protein
MDLLTTLAKAHVGECLAPEEAVRLGLRSTDQACSDLAVDVACGDPRRYSPALIEAWFRRPAARTRLVAALRRDPLLVLESLRPAAVAEPAATPEGDAPLERWFGAPRAAQAAAAFASAEREGRDGGELLRHLPGLHQLVVNDRELPEERRAVHAARLAAHEEKRFPGQIGIVPSYRCNRSCEYCFSSQRQYPGGKDMTLEQLRLALDVIAGKGGVTRIHLFGGEPTFFPGAAAFVEELGRRGLRFFFATNGIGPEGRIRALLDSPALLQVTLHVEPRASYSDDEWRSLLRTARDLDARPVSSVVRFNFTDPDEASWEYLDPFVEALPRAHVSFAVVFPAADRRNRHASLEGLFRFGPTLARFGRWARRRWGAVTLVLAKPFPLCAFSPPELAEVLGTIEYHNICEIRRRRFSDQIMVHPDLTVTPCMAVTAAAYREAAPLPIDELAQRFGGRLARLIGSPMLERCGACRLFRVGACQAACYAYVQ